tara:strand:- start:2588 stop:3742 length:1155 start_codon:yes stop_codon:yes gene_type:complete
MAYNVVKGIVEGSVDQHADQEIEGVKVFKSTISASVFYDTDAESPCATENKVAFDTLVKSPTHGVLTYIGAKTAKGHYNLTFDGKTLRTDSVMATCFTGSAGGLSHIPAHSISGLVPAESINYSKGLASRDHQLVVQSGDGVCVTSAGVEVSLSPHGALDFKNGKLYVSPTNCANVQEKGQNIGDADILMVEDVSRGETRHTSLKNLYDGYLKFKTPHPDGPQNSLQFKGTKSFAGSDKLTYDPSSTTLNVKGKVRSLKIEASSLFQSHGETHINGAVFKDIKEVCEQKYLFQDGDHTVLFNTSDCAITARLPPACDNAGRVLVIKKICSDGERYKIKGTHILKIITGGELIDYTNMITLKSSYSTRTLHSDGKKWWIIERGGS